MLSDLDHYKHVMDDQRGSIVDSTGDLDHYTHVMDDTHRCKGKQSWDETKLMILNGREMKWGWIVNTLSWVNCKSLEVAEGQNISESYYTKDKWN